MKPAPSREKILGSKVNGAAALLLALGLLHAIAGVASLSGVSELKQFGMDWKFAVLGAVYVGLAYFTWRRSRPALIAATVIFGGHAAMLAAQLVAGEVRMPISGVLIRTLLTLPMIEGISALAQLERARDSVPSPAP